MKINCRTKVNEFYFFVLLKLFILFKMQTENYNEKENNIKTDKIQNENKIRTKILKNECKIQT